MHSYTQPSMQRSIWSERLTSLSYLSLPFLKRSPKTHDYTQQVSGENYLFETIDGGIRGYMTGYGKGVKLGDYLIFQNESGSSERYQVDEIEYYSNPSDMWVALLRRA